MAMFRKVLVANRGEIAVAIIRALRDLGIYSVAVYSEADKDSLHVQIADESVCIGPASSTDSYLNAQAILSACEITGAEAIHPGFGFLSENPAFARMCQKLGITFIGPRSETISLLGDKAKAKQEAEKVGVPTVPGSKELPETVARAQELAAEIGYPIMIKATAGGGGRGMRIANTEEELPKAYLTAKQEARVFFGDERVYLERFIAGPRHIEVQILGDGHGNVIQLGDRDCSIQRRNQKLLEEARAANLSETTRQKMYQASVSLASALNYAGAGTVEYLVDEDENFYFMEMNTRIQVEHPVSEMITGQNLIQEQIYIGAYERLRLKQEDIKFAGHAIECRINIEDPLKNFQPVPGKIEALLLPGGAGVRVDSAIYQGYEIPLYYDSMLAKLIVTAPTRLAAIQRMRRALMEFTVVGVPTNIDFHLAILRDVDFVAGNYDIAFLDQKLPQILEELQEQ